MMEQCAENWEKGGLKSIKGIREHKKEEKGGGGGIRKRRGLLV